MQGVEVITDSNFESEVISSPTTVAVDFWAAWCGPCRMLAPIMEQVAEDLGDKVKVTKLNVDENPATAGKYGIMSIPTVLAFRNGEVIGRSVGVKSKQDMENWLQSL